MNIKLMRVKQFTVNIKLINCLFELCKCIFMFSTAFLICFSLTAWRTMGVLNQFSSAMH